MIEMILKTVRIIAQYNTNFLAETVFSMNQLLKFYTRFIRTLTI
jgi:hypothetical protein